MNGFLGGNAVGSVTMDLPANEFDFLSAGMTVDTLTFQSDVPSTLWLMDNFDYTVPEPASVLLLISGLALAGLRKLAVIKAQRDPGP